MISTLVVFYSMQLIRSEDAETEVRLVNKTLLNIKLSLLDFRFNACKFGVDIIFGYLRVLGKGSKRMSCRKRYKIEKKVSTCQAIYRDFEKFV